jgi:hypothetical protein
MRHNIPLELRELPQWVCTNADKIPLNPRTGQAASVSDPRTWSTFKEASERGSKYVGFVLTSWDPYTIIDLDNKPEKPCTQEEWARHQKILEYFDSYTERSASGTGYHVIVKGTIPLGARRDNVEVYSTGRYMICTGDVVRQSPITNHQELLDQLYAEIAPDVYVTDMFEYEAVLDDEEVIAMGDRAVDGEKFTDLCNGDYEKYGYPSQSEADFALLSMFAFYTRDNDQVRRLFRFSALGKREKAIKDNRYIDTCLKKIRAKEPPPVDISKLTLKPTVELAQEVEVEEKVMSTGWQLTWPPGLVGEIAQYVLDTTVRPVPEIALSAAIAICAGVCGRSYNISDYGLNQYIILLAKTGTGKEGAATGIDNLIAAVRQTVPTIDNFMGPSAFASGQALIKELNERPCFLSILGEFGLTLQQLCDPRANSAEVMLKKVLLDLYSKSGWRRILRPNVYSDKEKNTAPVQAPNVTILGEATPESFFLKLDSQHIAEGLIPRFTVVEYTGPRTVRNRNANCPPSQELVDKFVDLATIGLTMANNHTCATVQMDKGAVTLLDAFDTFADDKINNSGTDVTTQLWNRAQLKALKMAGLIAVGVDPHNPIVTKEIAQWSVDFVANEITAMATRFSKGDTGDITNNQENDIRRAIDDYFAMNEKTLLGYKVPKQLVGQAVVPFHYLRRRARALSSFKSDKKGQAKGLEEILKEMVKAEVLVLIPPAQSYAKYKVRSELYIKGETW